MRILIADDNREIRWALRLALLELSENWTMGQSATESPAGARCTILEAVDAAEVHMLLKNRDVHMLLLDWELPGLNGATGLQQVRSHAPRCTVIAMSGRPEARNESLGAGADYFVGKSDAPSKLLDLLRSLWLAA